MTKMFSVLILIYALVACLMFARRIYNWIKTLLNQATKAASKAAEDSVKSREHVRKIYSSRLITDEPTRWIFAVFYDDGILTRPTKYCIVAVGKTSEQVEKVDADEVDRYRIRGRK